MPSSIRPGGARPPQDHDDGCDGTTTQCVLVEVD